MTQVVGDAAFVRDTLFMPDSGTAPSRVAITRALSFHQKGAIAPGVSCGHDYAPGGRDIRWQTTRG
jgi:hypothetical protein